MSLCKIGLVTQENPAGWACTWCQYVNIRQYVGIDHCSACGAAALTYFTGYENEIKVRYSKPPATSHLDCVGTAGGKAATSTISYSRG